MPSINANTLVQSRLTQAEVDAICVKHDRLWSSKPGGARAVFAFKDLRGVDLHGRNLCDADFTGAILINCNVRGARLDNATLFCSDLTNADVRHAIFTDADISRANFSGAQLKQASFAGVLRQGARGLDEVI